MRQRRLRRYSDGLKALQSQRQGCGQPFRASRKVIAKFESTQIVDAHLALQGVSHFLNIEGTLTGFDTCGRNLKLYPLTTHSKRTETT